MDKENEKAIKGDIERSVAHLSRFHDVGYRDIWAIMYLQALEHLK